MNVISAGPPRHVPVDYDMNRDLDHHSSRNVPFWPILVGSIVALAGIAGLIGSFLIGYTTGPSVPADTPNGPAWNGRPQSEPENSTDSDSPSIDRSLFENVAADNTEIEIEINRDSKLQKIGLTPQSTPEKINGD